MASAVQGNAGAAPPLDRRMKMVAAAVVLGALMTVFDATIVAVAIDKLSDQFGSSLATIQWVMTAYILALAAVIPLTGWAADRFGGKRVWTFSLVLFVGASMLSGLAWSAGSLIAFRVLQGLGGGMIVPVGMAMVAQAAGPQRMGRAMSIVGVPMMLGPVLGPVLGGLLVSTVSWQWIFYINVPIGAVALLWSWKVMPDTASRRSEKLDLVGLLLLSPGLALVVFGVSELSSSSGSTGVLVGLVGGFALLALFVVHALRAEKPLLDLRHFANRAFTAAASVQALTGVVLQGGMLLLPLYYQVVHGESALNAGLLLMPQGIGAALTMTVTGRLVDRGFGRALVFTGLPVMAAGFVAFTQAGAGNVVTSASMFVLGIGTGAVIAPLMQAAYAAVDRADIPRATSTLNILQRMGGAVGTAVIAVLLQHNLAHAGAGGVEGAFNATFLLPLVVAAAAVLPTLLLPRSKPRPVPEQPERREPAKVA